MSNEKRFRLEVDLDMATFTCPCGSSCTTDEIRHARDEEFSAWEATHRAHTDDKGASILEVWNPAAWAKCFSGPMPPPTVKAYK
jgi:hypothetical protein